MNGKNICKVAFLFREGGDYCTRQLASLAVCLACRNIITAVEEFSC